MRNLASIKYVINRYLAKNVIMQDPQNADLWHVGEGTDMDALVFKANLTKADRDFLQQLRIKID